MRDNRVKPSKKIRKYTLIELMVVAAVIALLLGIAAITAIGINERSQENSTKVALTMVQNAIEAYFSEYGEYPDSNSSNQLAIPKDGNLAKYLNYNDLTSAGFIKSGSNIFLDYWKEPVVYIAVTDKKYGSADMQYTLLSKGVDKKLNTKDDIIIKKIKE